MLASSKIRRVFGTRRTSALTRWAPYVVIGLVVYAIAWVVMLYSRYPFNNARASREIAETILTVMARVSSTHPGTSHFIIEDNDFDVMVVTESEADWKEVQADIIQSMMATGVFWRCHKSYQKKEWKIRMDSISCLYGYAWLPTILYSEIHSAVLTPAKDYLYMRQARDANNAVVYPGPPFQSFNGLLPASFIFPMRACRVYSLEAPCPQDPIQVLTYWDGQSEYSSGCLLYFPGYNPPKIVFQQMRAFAAERAAARHPNLLSEFDRDECVPYEEETGAKVANPMTYYVQ